MPYNYGAKNGPSLGKAAPGLPVPAKYDNSLNILTNQLVAGGRKFINPNFNDRSDWTKVTSGAAPGSATVSAIQSVPNSGNLLLHPASGGLFAGALKISDTTFVALTTENSTQNKTNLTLFDVSNGNCVIKSQVTISTDTQGYCGSAQIIPSSRPDLILVSHRLYGESAQRLQFFRVDANAGVISNANTGTQSSPTALSISASQWGIPWVITPLGYFGGIEVWAACSSITSTVYLITLTDLAGSSIASASGMSSVGFLQRVGEDASNIYVAGMSHPMYGGSYNTSYPSHFVPFRIFAINKSTFTATAILSQSAYGCGVFSGTYSYSFGGFVSYGFNGEGFFLDFDVNGDPGPSSYAVIDSYSTGTLLRADLSDLSRLSAQHLGRTLSAMAWNLVPVSPDVVAVRTASTVPWSGPVYESLPSSRPNLSFGWFDAFGSPKSSYVQLTGLGSGARSTQIVPFGDRLLVLDKTGSNQAQFVWVYPQ